jgi:hypothetical protein
VEEVPSLSHQDTAASNYQARIMVFKKWELQETARTHLKPLKEAKSNPFLTF